MFGNSNGPCADPTDMSSVGSVLIREHLGTEVTDDDFRRLATRTSISVDRLVALEAGDTNPHSTEIGVLAETLGVDPIHLFRTPPSIRARRRSSELAADPARFLTTVDLHLAAYEVECTQELPPRMPVNSVRGARRTGEGWASGNQARGFSLDRDPLFDAVQGRLGIPIVIWPICDAPFGATVTFGDMTVIWVNSHDVPGSQQRFTLAHEVGHLALGHVHDLRMEPSNSAFDSSAGASPLQTQEEREADSFAAGVMGDYDTLHALWDRDATPQSVARVASALGASYEATLNLLSAHFRVEHQELIELRGAAVWRAYRGAGLIEVYQHFEDQRNRKYVSELIEREGLLEAALERAVG